MKNYVLPSFTAVILCCFVTLSYSQSTSTQSLSFDLYKRLGNGNSQNLFFSPFSVNSALTMAYLGAEGKTELAFEKAMNLPHDKKANIKKLADYVEDMQRVRGVELKVSNNIWLNNTFPAKEKYTKLLNKMDVGTFSLDFFNQPESSRVNINKKVDKETNGKVKGILPDGSINNVTQFVMTNAIYFLGNWDDPFDKEESNVDAFTVDTQTERNVTFMNKKSRYKYLETDDYQVIELPYKKKAMSMLIILPKEKDGLTALEDNLSAKEYAVWNKKMKKREVQVIFPKFKMSSNIGIGGYLYGMGLGRAFSSAANFNGISDHSVYLSNAFHQATVEVNETGTEASASTVILGMSKGIAEKTPIFKANRPFFYIIKENSEDEILFMGRMNDPIQTATKLEDPLAARKVKEDKFIHVVSKGETLFKIASAYEMPVESIRLSNVLVNDFLFVGQKLLINKTERSKGGSLANINVPTSYNQQIASNSLATHTVKKGETLYKISKKYNLSPTDIKKYNDLKTNDLRLGQKLQLVDAPKTNVPKQKVDIAFKYSNEKKRYPHKKTIGHSVKKGDTLSKLAKQQWTTVDYLKWLNNLNSNVIYVGQKLKLPTRSN